MIDARSQKNIDTLNEDAAEKAREWYRRCQRAGIRLKITDGTRTYEEQDRLYAQGRTVPGKIRTKARAGYSWHNFGFAWDFTLFDEGGNPVWEGPDYSRAGEIAEEMGLEWGGRWKFVDEPHVQLKTGLSLAQLRAARLTRRAGSK